MLESLLVPRRFLNLQSHCCSCAPVFPPISSFAMLLGKAVGRALRAGVDLLTAGHCHMPYRMLHAVIWKWECAGKCPASCEGGKEWLRKAQAWQRYC